MTQRNLQENIQTESIQIDTINVITGDRFENRFLYWQLKDSINHAERIDIIVSFLMDSGVKMIIDDLKFAIKKGVSIRILTGNYLGITQPSALYRIKRGLGEQVDLRFYNEKKRSFHPKSYIFHYKNGGEIYIGSSNVSKSALTSGIEWNYRMKSQTDEENFNLFYQTFLDLFEHHSILLNDEELKRYSKNWHKPAVEKDLARYDDLEDYPNHKIEDLFEPRGIQIEAMYALENSREEGATKALIVAATGVGKTYLAAYDSRKYKRVLFVAHREEILKQAAQAFRNVRKSEDYGFFYGKEKDKDKSAIFASVATLGRDEYLNEKFFTPDYFEYIVIDEFHHSVNDGYQRIINYFRPQFLLGLTATPERMDGKNIYEICEYNVPFEISLKEAINKGILVPFHYYGIYDETDYSHFHVVRGKYSESDLNKAYIKNKKRYDLIYKYYKKYPSKRALGFCCSRQHAEEMAKEFCKRGVKSVAVYSNADGEFSEERDRAIEKLEKREIQVIFSVDMFNEGVDIPSLDMVLFLRPTESSTVFLQQLGRGLRTYKGKEYLNVLDFIGNYEKAGKAPLLLSGEMSFSQDKAGEYQKIEYPDDCFVDFDIKLIDLFKELDKKSLSIKEQIQKEYYRIKELLEGKVPTRMELFTYMEGEVYQYCIKHTKENPFQRYLDFLYDLRELTEEEMKVYTGVGREFLHLIETTNMQKVYKMPILYSFYNSGNIRMQITEEEMLESWKNFFNEGVNWRDFSENISYEEYKKMTDKQHIKKAKQMPVKYLLSSGKSFFVEKDGYILALRKELQDVIKDKVFVKQMKDILEYRTMEYYRRRYEGSRKVEKKGKGE